MTNEHVLVLKEVSKSFQTAQGPVSVLDTLSLQIEAGTVCALVGPSGSGKTTLLALSAGLERPSTGEIVLCGKHLETSSENELAAIRREHVGFVFQAFQLLPGLTALENVMVPAELRSNGDCRNVAEDLLERVGLKHRLHHYPLQLSGGEQQRVALARAFINQPKVLFADEPTGNLDEKNAAVVEELLFELNAASGATLLLATHNLALAGKADRRLTLAHGMIAEG